MKRGWLITELAFLRNTLRSLGKELDMKDSRKTWRYAEHVQLPKRKK